MSIIIGAIKIIILLGTLITIHELGHFLVAKACKVKVHKFAIGFGPKIWKKQGKETEYTLRLIPFGGFVQLEGEEERSEDKRAFNQKPIYQRILIIVAGATVNIIFALMLYFCVSFSSNLYYSNQLLALNENTPEYKAGLRSGDEIIKVNNKNVLVGYDAKNVIEDSKTDNFEFIVRRDNQEQKINVEIPITTKGLLGIRYTTESVVAGIVDDTPASMADIQSGDKILAINNSVIDNYEQISEIISELPNQEVSLQLERNGEVKEINVETISTTDRFYNISFGAISPVGLKKVVYALNETGDYFNATIEGIVTLFKGKTDNVEVMGPVGIAGQISSTAGFAEFFYLMSAISLSLGIFNLLPIPGLDGGKILFLIIEKIRRKPFEEQTEINATLIGFSLIFLLALVVTVADVAKLF